MLLSWAAVSAILSSSLSCPFNCWPIITWDELLGIRKNTLKSNGSIGMSKIGLFWNKEMVWDLNECYGTETGWYGSEGNIVWKLRIDGIGIRCDSD